MRFTLVKRGKAGQLLFDHKRVGKFNPWLANNTSSKTIFCEIHAQQSTGAPPLGPILGAKGIPLNKFNDDFNKVSAHIKSGVPLNCKVEFVGAGKWTTTIIGPTLAFNILQAAGLSEPSHAADEIMGRITLKQVFEIAKYHATSEWNIARDLTEREIIPMVIEEARKFGVEVVRDDMTAEDYSAFRNHAKLLKETYEKRKAQEEKDKLEEMRRKAAEARKAAAAALG